MSSCSHFWRSCEVISSALSCLMFLDIAYED
jgi:hypothetical protein